MLVDEGAGQLADLGAQIGVVQDPVGVGVLHGIVPAHHLDASLAGLGADVLNRSGIGGMHHDQVAAGGDEVLDLADLGGGGVVAGDDGELSAGLGQNGVQGGHDAGPVGILQGLDGDAQLLAGQNGQVCLGIELRGRLNALGLARGLSERANAHEHNDGQDQCNEFLHV